MIETMFKRLTKKQLMVRRIIVSTIMVLAVLTIVTGTILFILGYRIDSSEGRLEQGALVQFESQPNSARVSIDGKQLSSRTTTKQSVLAGMHTFMMQKDGYNDWSKTLDVKAGTLNWLDYVRLVPKDLRSEALTTYQTVYAEKASPDLQSILVQEKADTPTFQLVDIRAQDIKTSILTLPATVYSDPQTVGVAHTFTIDRWDGSGRYVMLKHGYNDKTEWIVLDTQNPAASSNVTKLLSISITDARFAGTNGKILYALMSDKTVRKLDLSATTISRALVTNVQSFEIYDTNVVSYVGVNPADATQQVAGIYRDGDDKSQIIRSADVTAPPLMIAATRYYSDYYVAIAQGEKISVLSAENLSVTSDGSSSLQKYDTLSAPANITKLSFSPSGVYVLAQAGLQAVSYDVEYQRTNSSTIATTETTARPLQWLDRAYVWVIYDGRLSIREFDGTNTHDLTAAEPAYDATLSPGGRYIYSIGKSGDTYQLQRVKMILD